MAKAEQYRIERQLNYYLAKTSILLRTSSMVKMAYGLSIMLLQKDSNLRLMKFVALKISIILILNH